MLSIGFFSFLSFEYLIRIKSIIEFKCKNILKGKKNPGDKNENVNRVFYTNVWVGINLINVEIELCMELIRERMSVLIFFLNAVTAY
jgi:hypothetical protein